MSETSFSLPSSLDRCGVLIALFVLSRVEFLKWSLPLDLETLVQDRLTYLAGSCSTLHIFQQLVDRKAMPERNGSATTMICDACDDLLLACSQPAVLYWVTSNAYQVQTNLSLEQPSRLLQA